jgi:hypothetical protein
MDMLCHATTMNYIKTGIHASEISARSRSLRTDALLLN